jgi:hypothetical protein
MVRSLPLVDEVDRVCEACLAGKHRRALFPRRAMHRTEDVLELVHAVLCGRISPPTSGGKRYFLLLVGDKSRFMWLGRSGTFGASMTDRWPDDQPVRFSDYVTAD